MRPMQLNPRKARISHQPRRINKLPNHPLNIGPGHLPRRRPRDGRNNPLQTSIADVNGHGTRSNRLREHAPFAGDAERLAAGVADLCQGRRAVFLGDVGVFLPLGHEVAVAAFAGVFVVQGWIEGGAEVVYVDLDVSYIILSFVLVRGLAEWEGRAKNL